MLRASKLVHYSPSPSRAKTRKTKRNPKHLIALGRGKHEEELLFFPSRNTRPSFCTRVHLQVFLPQFLSHWFCLFLSCALSLCGILAAILALGSHLSFGGTHAFLLADGTPTHTHTEIDTHACKAHSLSNTAPVVLKIKRPTEDVRRWWSKGTLVYNPVSILSPTLIGR